MRRTRLVPVLVVSLALFGAACGESSSQADDTAASDTRPASTDDTADTAGTDDSSSDTTTKPELVITDLTEGEGAEAAAGDTVIVNYVGVRSEDGTEFDNSYDRGEPFPVTLGAGQVIQGWDQGLLGARQGGRRQLDIPADLAYGDNPQGEIIQAGDALTFVVDVVAVIPKSDPADAPVVTIEAGTTFDELVIDELTAGSGDPLEDGQTLAFHFIAIRTDTGEQISTSWETGEVQPLPYTSELPTVLLDGLAGIRLGERRQLGIPYELAKDAFNIPEETDLVLVIDAVAIY
jgi:FKBP-type peptidyl-prolyl cis-trans isomerase